MDRTSACPYSALHASYIAVRSQQLTHFPTSLRPTTASQRGFTLIELMVTVALVAILATLAMPSYSEFLRNWRRDSASRALTADIQMARTQSIKKSRQVVMCPSANGTACAGNSNWQTGWLVFVDVNADQTINAGESILSVGGAASGIATITGTGGVTSLIFLPSGLMGSAATNITITPSGATPTTNVSRINLSRTGRTQTTTYIP